MTLENFRRERGVCSGGLIVFRVGVKSCQQVSGPSRPGPQGRRELGGRPA
jgi:hypothetical protein